MNKKIIIPIVLALVVTGIVLKFTVFKSKFRYAGTLEVTQTDLSSRVASVIQEVLVEEGQKVEKGQLLVRLACEDIRLAAKLDAENFERARSLFKVGSLPKEQFDLALNKKQDSETRVGWCEITAPFSGYVVTLFQEQSEWVNPGTKIVALADLNDISAYIYVPQTMVNRLKPGMKADGLLPELGDKIFKGTILRINPEAEFTPKNVQTQAERTRLVFGVKIGFENQDETLKPGMTIEVPLFEE